MSKAAILHETAQRLRVALDPALDLGAVRAGLQALPGVASVRVSAALRCVVVQHDGRAETRAAVLARLRRGSTAARAPAGRPRKARPPSTGPLRDTAGWTPAVVAAAVPLLPRDWQPGAALAAVATRVLSQPQRLRQDPPAVLLDAASLASLAVSGQPAVVSASVLLRMVSERLAARLVHHADELLDHLLPTEAERYSVFRDANDGTSWRWWPLRALRAGDRVRLFPGDVVPVDGCVVEGSATMAVSAHRAAARTVQAGEHLAAGERLQEGTLELRAEAEVAASRLARMRAHVRHATGSRDPAGRLSPGLDRLISLPLTAAAVVLGLTGDTARSAAMLQADPQQGLDLALPLAREAALYALARRGLLTGGLEAIERLATARTLVLQDTGVLASGRWTIEAVHTEPGGDPETVRRWLAALADTPVEVLHQASFPDPVVRQWVRHGALLRVGAHELHLASRQRLRRVWGWALDAAAAAVTAGGLRRELAVVAAGRVVARVLLASAWRPSALDRLDELAALGFDRVVVFAEADGDGDPADAVSTWAGHDRLTSIPDVAALRSDWLADAVSDGQPLVMVHTVLRDLVPPGSLSLTPMDADAGAHGVLLGDPLASLAAARHAARAVHRRLGLQQGLAVGVNAALMTASALRWLPPMATALLHHGFALLLVLDSLRLESLQPEADPEPATATARSDTA